MRPASAMRLFRALEQASTMARSGDRLPSPARIVQGRHTARVVSSAEAAEHLHPSTNDAIMGSNGSRVRTSIGSTDWTFWWPSTRALPWRRALMRDDDRLARRRVRGGRTPNAGKVGNVPVRGGLRVAGIGRVGRKRREAGDGKGVVKRGVEISV